MKWLVVQGEDSHNRKMNLRRMKLIDTHSHIYDPRFAKDIDQVIQRAVEEGVDRIFLPAIDSKSHGALSKLCTNYQGVCLPMMGLHPTSINDNPKWREELDLVERYLSKPQDLSVERFYAVGEVGLDLHWSRDWIGEQMEAFERQIEMSIEYKLPLAIHVRGAWREVLSILERYKGVGLRGVMHSFSGSYSDYMTIKECGEFLFGVSGVVTYKNSEIAELLPRMSLSDIVLETDAPYLTPTPFRGARNESSYVKYICAAVAEIMARPISDIAEITTTNALSMFGIIES